MKDQCKKCGRMILIAQIPEEDKQLFLNANICSRCVKLGANK